MSSEFKSQEESLEDINESLGILNNTLREMNSTLKAIQYELHIIWGKQTEIAENLR